MTKLEHFKQWAGVNHPAAPQDGGERNGKFYFYDQFLQFAWRAFQHALTVRPTENSRLDKATFGKGDNPATLVDRLQGMFPTADPPYPVPEIQYEAAREIVRLRGQIAGATPAVGQWWILVGEYDQHDTFACKVCKHLIRVDVQGVPLPEECPNCNDRPGPVSCTTKR